MTFAAVLPVAEADARALLDALERDEALAARPIDLSETAPGRWEVVVYFEEEPEAAELAALASAAAAALGRSAPAFTIGELPATDWVEAEPRRLEADPRRPIPRPWPA